MEKETFEISYRAIKPLKPKGTAVKYEHAARILGVDKATLKRWIKEGRFETVKGTGKRACGVLYDSLADYIMGYVRRIVEWDIKINGRMFDGNDDFQNKMIDEIVKRFRSQLRNTPFVFR